MDVFVLSIASQFQFILSLFFSSLGFDFSLLILLPIQSTTSKKDLRNRLYIDHSSSYFVSLGCFCVQREKREIEEMKKHVVLVKPFSLEDEKDSEHTPPNLIQRILSLFKNVRPGSDLTNFQVYLSVLSLSAFQVI